MDSVFCTWIKYYLNSNTEYQKLRRINSILKTICKRKELNKRKNLTDIEQRNIIRNKLETTMYLVG